jgi:hypothetical protein
MMLTLLFTTAAPEIFFNMHSLFFRFCNNFEEAPGLPCAAVRIIDASMKTLQTC